MKATLLTKSKIPKTRTKFLDPLTKPTAAMKKAAKRAVIPEGANAFVIQTYRDAAMLRCYWHAQP